jgi:hypothetical protein
MEDLIKSHVLSQETLMQDKPTAAQASGFFKN